MADTTNDNDATSKQQRLTADECQRVVEQVEDMIGGYRRDDVLCILMTVTVNAIHAGEDRGERQRVEEEYIKAFRFLSAVEEQFQPNTPDERPDWVNECVGKMMRHVFRAIGLGVEIPE